MFCYLFIYLRILSPNQYNKINNNRHINDEVIKSCNAMNNDVIEDQTFAKENYIFCPNSYMQITNCTFYKVKTSKVENSYLIHISRNNLEISLSNFIQIIYSTNMIYFETNYKYGDRDCEFTFLTNKMIDCDSLDYDDGRLIMTHSQKNNIQHNYIYFDPSIKLGQPFYLYYNDNCTFINNIIINAKCDYKGSAIYTKEDGVGNSLQISDCIFTNCTGTHGSIIYISDYQSNVINLINIKFNNIQNFNNDGDMIQVLIQKDTTINIKDCTFKYIECTSKAGGIGFGFYGHQNTFNFENTTFKHISHKHDSIGGGVIAFDSSLNNQLTKVSFDRCIFSNITDANKGGAFYLNLKQDNLIYIKDCTFDNIQSDIDGNAIYFEQTNSITVTIMTSHFINCGFLPNTYTIYINCDNFDFLDNEIIFTDPSKSCGCIKSNKYFEHNYWGNIFRNAYVDSDSFSAGIDESNSENSNNISLCNNVFDGISGRCNGRCININYAKSGDNIMIDNNTFQNCPSGGILIQFKFELQTTIMNLIKYHFINNSVNDALFNELQSCPQIIIINPLDGEFPFEITVNFIDCLFQKNYNPKKGGGLAYGKNKYNAYTKINFDNCHFIENNAKNGGSAISLIVYQGCKIENCKFIKNKSESGSGTIYIETDFECPSTSGKPSSRSPIIEIYNCNFEDNKGNDSGITINSSPNTPVVINECNFFNCGDSGYSISIQSNVQSTTIQNCIIKSTTSICSGGISIKSNGKIEISYIDFIKTSIDSSLRIESEETTEQTSITQCLFDSCTGASYSCFYISTQTDSFIFKNLTFKDIKLTGYDNYLGSFKLNGHINIEFYNLTFTNIACSCLYGGGTGMIYSGISELIFQQCDFSNNEAHQDTSHSRPINGAETNPYYNGDGGAIQIGCQSETAEMLLRFKNCVFQNNKAARHGGAVAIQTIKEIEFFRCKMNHNYANYDFKSSNMNLLYENHFHKKKEGRGGAFYINPAAGCVDSYTENVIINDCEFNWNNAYDGYAIYVEGDDPGTIFSLISNNFHDNYNEKNYDYDPNILYGAVITTEIFSINEETLRPPDQKDNYNYFSNSNKKLEVPELSYVDHYGKTKTNAFTESEYFHSNNFTSSFVFSSTSSFSFSNEFSKSNPFSQSNNFPKSSFFTKSKQFSDSNKFSDTKIFTTSKQFSESNSFSNSNPFNPSKQFSPSDSFSNSNMFSQSNKFTLTDKFSCSNEFSFSYKFSMSKKFPCSSQFSKSSGFSYSNKFTQTNKFSFTPYFSESRKFSSSKDFTNSDAFLPSNPFLDSKKFSESKGFTSSDIFSQTNKFSLTNPFSYINQFSSSQSFSPSMEPKESLPHCGFFDDDFISLDECNYTANENKLIYIYVLVSNFTNYEKDLDGSAVHLVNCGIHCNYTYYIDCVSHSGGGGAIYIKNTFDMINNATFINVSFINCSSNYGGAVFLYSSSELFNVTFNNCYFESNKALAISSTDEKNKNLFGGNALFLMCRQINITFCTFIRNKGRAGAIKFYNKFDENSKSIHKLEEENSFIILGCNFEQDELSKSSVDYIDDNTGKSIDINNCIFKGKLKKGSRYISGKLHNKENLRISSCNFEFDENYAVDFDSLDNELSINNDKFDLNFKYNNSVIIIACIYFSVAILVLIAIILLLNRHFNNHELKELMSDKSNVNSFEIEIL